jgi:hypothetical protein
MGKSVLCRYRIEFEGEAPIGLQRKVKLDEYIRALVDSYKVGGVNEHVSRTLGYIPVPKSAKLINQYTGKVVETWEHPKFMVI